MAKNDNLKDLLTDVADAIREKKGTTEKINPQDFSSEIKGIESGSDFPADIVMVNDTEFGLNNGIKEISIKEGITVLSSYAFRYDRSIEKIILPQSLTAIKEYAFSGMTKINHIDLPENVDSLGTYVFNGSPFRSLIFPKKIGMIRYGTCVNCASLESVEILYEGKSNISATAFKGCTALRYISFPNHTAVCILDNTNGFDNTTCQFVVPDALYDQWIVATNWATYADRIVKASEFIEPTND